MKIKKIAKKMCMGLVLLIIVSTTGANASFAHEENDVFMMEEMYLPHDKLGRYNKQNSQELSEDDTSKWRIAYVLMDESSVYVNTLDNLLKGLIASGWLNASRDSLLDYPRKSALESQTIKLWKWMEKEKTNSYLAFTDCFYPDGEAADDLDKFTKEVVMPGIKEADLVIAMGDTAAEQLTRAGCTKKMMVLEASDPVALHIVEGTKASGKKNIWAHIDQKKYINQIEMFYNTFPFKKLGVISDNTNNSYEEKSEEEKAKIVKEKAQLNAINEVAKEKGFSVIYENVDDQKGLEVNIGRAFGKLSEKADAVYLAHYKNGNALDMEEILIPCYSQHVYTFSETASKVHKGMLMSATTLEDEGVQAFYADTVARILVSDNLSDIRQEYMVPPQIILNLQAAQMSHVDIQFELLLAADQVLLENER